MSELILLFVYCALLGSVVGFLAGLLGIGGGLVIVPVLSSILLYFNVLPPEQVVIAAVATSLASILFTSTSSAIAHHKNGNVPWDVAPWIMTGRCTRRAYQWFFGCAVTRKRSAHCICSKCGIDSNKNVL